MAMTAFVELRGLRIGARIGTYGPGDVVPEAHLLDLVLSMPADLVVIADDGMEHVFDYDPLVREIEALARAEHYHTQERLLTRIMAACAREPRIEAVEAALTKTPVLNDSGHRGVRVRLDRAALDDLLIADG